MRNPPHPDNIRATGMSGADVEAGSVPAFLPMCALDVHTGAYAHGLLVTAMSRAAGAGRGAAADGDELLCLFEDLTGRAGGAQAGAPPCYPSQAPSMREGVCVPREWPDGSSIVRGRIHDVRESCLAIHSPEAAVLQVRPYLMHLGPYIDPYLIRPRRPSCRCPPTLPPTHSSSRQSS